MPVQADPSLNSYIRPEDAERRQQFNPWDPTQLEGPTPLVIFEIQLKKKFFFLSITWGWAQ